MRYILNDSGFIETISFTYEIECNNKTCTEYTGSVPTGYESLAEWSELANINAYKIVNGELIYDSAEDTRLQDLWAEQQTSSSSGGYDSLPVGSIINFDGDEAPVGYEEVSDDIEYSIEEKVVGTYVNGKPIYQKTFTGTYSNGATLLSNVDKMIRVEGQVFIGDMYRLVPYYEVYNGQNYIGVVRVYKNNVTTDFKVAGSGVSALIDITIRYTKTTD